MELVHVSDLVILGSNPARVTASLLFSFQKSVDIVYEEAAITRFGIVTRDLVFVDFEDFQNFISFVYGQSYLVYDPRAFQASLSVAAMLTFARGIVFLDTCSTQAQ